MGIREKMKRAAVPKPYRSAREVVAEWRSKAKYPGWGQEDEYLRVFKYADGMGDVFVRDGDNGRIRLTYGGTKGLPFDDEIAWAINSDFNVTPVPEDEFHVPEEALVIEQYILKPKDPLLEVYHHLYVYSNGMGALEDLDVEEHDTVVPVRDMVPLEELEGYFDEERWEVKRVV